MYEGLIEKKDLTLKQVLSAVKAFNRESADAEIARECFCEHLYEDKVTTVENHIVKHMLRDLEFETESVAKALGTLHMPKDGNTVTELHTRRQVITNYEGMKSYYSKLMQEMESWQNDEFLLAEMKKGTEKKKAIQNYAFVLAEKLQKEYENYCKNWKTLHKAIVRLSQYKENMMLIKMFVFHELGICITKNEVQRETGICSVWFTYEGKEYVACYSKDGPDISVPCVEAILDVLNAETEELTMEEAIIIIYSFFRLPLSDWMEDDRLFFDRGIWHAATLAEDAFDAEKISEEAYLEVECEDRYDEDLYFDEVYKFI